MRRLIALTPWTRAQDDNALIGAMRRNVSRLNGHLGIVRVYVQVRQDHASINRIHSPDTLPQGGAIIATILVLQYETPMDCAFWI